jgi:hypothetical protein
VYPPDDEPQHVVVIEGEIRDFVTFNAEPAASVDVWTSDPGYKPTATVDPSGHYTLWIDLCRKDAATGDQILYKTITGFSSRCRTWLAKFRFRARLADRCSITYESGLLPKNGKPLVLWLHDPCREPFP